MFDGIIFPACAASIIMTDWLIVDSSQPSFFSNVVERADGTRENWSPVQINGVAGGDEVQLLARFTHLESLCYALILRAHNSFARLCSFACVES